MASRKDHKILLEEWEMPTKWYNAKGGGGGEKEVSAKKQERVNSLGCNDTF
jgi:hypothetical protein